MNEQLQAALAKLPLIPLLLLYGGYLGWNYYSFTSDPGSPLLQRVQSLQQIQQQTALERAKIKKAQEFYQSLEQRRTELRGLALQLEQAKASLSEDIDVSSFVRQVVGEANKVGLTVLGIKPTDTRQHEYYVEQAFELRFRGVFVQLRVLMQRLSELDRIVRVGKLNVKPVNAQDSEYVLLEGDMELDTYRYKGSQADELGKGGAAGAPGGAANPPGSGGGK